MHNIESEKKTGSDQNQYDVVVVGEINADLILTGNVVPSFGQVEQFVDDANLVMGSSAVIFACAAARLKLSVAFIGVVGNDTFGSFMLKALADRDVDITPIIQHDSQRTGLSVILNHRDGRAILTYPGAINALRSEQIPNELLARARHLHVASYFLQSGLHPGLPDLFARARGLGLSISMDTNWDPGGKWIGVRDLLPLMDVFLPNENEACKLTKTDSVEIAARELASLSKVVALKLGKNGAMGIRGDIMIRSPAIPVEVVDTVGAGDTFDAGFIYGFLHNWPLEKSLRLGVVCGSLSTRAHGGTAAQPTLDEAMKFVSG